METLALMLSCLLLWVPQGEEKNDIPNKPEVQKVQKCFWPPDLIPHPHLPDPPKDDDRGPNCNV